MAGLPLLSGRKIISALSKIGYIAVRQRGSHIRLICVGRKPVTVPDYKEVDRSLLKKILRDAGITSAEFEKIISY